MDILTGDETGLLKFVAARSKAGIHSYGQQSRAAAIKGLCWLDYENKQFASFRSNGILDSWKMNGGEVLHQNSVHISNIKDPAGVVHLRNKVGSRDPLICYGAEGDICLVQVENSDEASNGDLVFDELSTLQLKGPLSTCEPFTNGFACGGKENDVVLYSLETQQVEWTAKNVPHDYLKLRVPIWIRGISFLRPHPQNTSSDALFATGTGYRHVRIYDTKTSRQPVTSIDIGEYPVTAIAAMPSSGDANSEALYVADASGGLSIWDLRMMRRQLTLKGSSGSIRCLNISNSGKHIASVGLDRYVRLYATGSNEQLSATYLKNRLNCCLIIDESAKDGSNDESEKKKKRKKGKKVSGNSSDGDDDDEEDDTLRMYVDSDEDGGDDDEDDEEEEDKEDNEEDDEELSSLEGEDDEEDEVDGGGDEEEEGNEGSDDDGDDDDEEDGDHDEDGPEVDDSEEDGGDDDEDGDNSDEEDDGDDEGNEDDDDGDDEENRYRVGGKSKLPFSSRRSRVAQTQKPKNQTSTNKEKLSLHSNKKQRR